VKEAHDLGRDLARLAHAALPGMQRLTVHSEPAEEAGEGSAER
jgi:hypothetical protein